MPETDGRTHRRMWLVGVIVVAAVGGGVSGGIALAEDSGPDLVSPSPAGRTISVPSSLASAFAALRAASTSSDALSGAAAASITDTGVFAHYGVNPSLSRVVGSLGGAPIWLVPGSSGSCMVLSSGASACAQNEVIAEDGAVIILVPTSGAPPTIEGIVPDGASVTTRNASGTESTVSLSGQAFVVSGADAVSLTIHTLGGSTVVDQLPNGKPPSGPPSSAF